MSQIAEWIDEFYTLREERLTLDRTSKAIKAKEEALMELITNELNGKPMMFQQPASLAIATINYLNQPPKSEEIDWPTLYDYIAAGHYFEILQKRLSVEGLKLRWQRGESVPGVEMLTVPNVSIKAL